MNYYGTFDVDGWPTGFWTSDIHGEQGAEGTTVPAEAIEITEAQWRELNENFGFRKFIDGDVVPVEAQL